MKSFVYRLLYCVFNMGVHFEFLLFISESAVALKIYISSVYNITKEKIQEICQHIRSVLEKYNIVVGDVKAGFCWYTGRHVLFFELKNANNIKIDDLIKIRNEIQHILDTLLS